MKKIIVVVMALFVGFVFSCSKPATKPTETGETAAQQAEEAAAVDAGNKTCPISGDKISGKDYAVYKGIKYGLCCEACKKMFEKNPEEYIKKLRERGDIR